MISVELFLDNFSSDLELAMRLVDRYKNPVFTIHQRLETHYNPAEKKVKAELIIPAAFIAPGKYSWVMCINRPGVTAYNLQNDVLCLCFRVLESGSSFARITRRCQPSVRISPAALFKGPDEAGGTGKS